MITRKNFIDRDGTGETPLTNERVNAALDDDPAASREAINAAPATFHYVTSAAMDGTTDDTAAIQAVLDLAATDSIAEVVLPPGTALISSALVIKARYGLRLRGAGPEVTIIRQSSVNEDVIKFRMNNAAGTGYIEFLEILDLSVEGPGLATSNGIGINMHDDRQSSEHFNGGSLRLHNVKIGNNGYGFATGLYLKRWDTSTISHCRILYNFRNVYLEAFTKTVTFIGCGNSQAESVLWHLGPSAKINLIGCDNGNAPQWYRVGYGSSVTVIGNNHESQRYSSSASRRYNYGASDYPNIASVSSISTSTGLITTSANHGLKPGVVVNIGYATIPTGVSVSELYEVLADGFTATTFKVAPVYRAGAVAAGSANITVSGTRTNTDDLTVGGKVRITTGTTVTDVEPGEYWIVGKPTSSTLTISETEGGTAITFANTGSVGVFPITALIPSSSGATVTIYCPSIALEHSSVFNTQDSQYTGRGDSTITEPISAVGTGCWFYSNGVWHSYGYTGTFGGRAVVIGSNALIDGKSVPVTFKTGTDALIFSYTTGTTIVENESSGYASTSARRGQFLAIMQREGTVGNDRLFFQCRDRNSAFSNEPVLNRDARITTSIGSGTAATPYELKPNTRYRVSFAAAAADVILNLPDDSTTGELLAVDDEIEIFVVDANSQTVKIRQVGVSTIRLGTTLTTSGADHGLTMVAGDKALLKCTSVAGVGEWQVVSVVGTLGTY